MSTSEASRDVVIECRGCGHQISVVLLRLDGFYGTRKCEECGADLVTYDGN